MALFLRIFVREGGVYIGVPCTTRFLSGGDFREHELFLVYFRLLLFFAYS